MKFTFGWLKEHLDTNASLDQIIETLNKIGLEVSSVKKVHQDLKKLKSVKIVKIDQHENADRLKVCQVFDGKEQVQVVCGAPNVELNMIGVFAPVGTYVPGINLNLSEVKIRGVSSNGMLCSEKELEISDDHDGIIKLSQDTGLGEDASKILGIDDPVIEIEITPNRGDCLGVRGIARDLSAYGLGNLKKISLCEEKGDFESSVKWNLNLPNNKSNLCNKIYGRTFTNLKNFSSPIWMKNRLQSIGLRPISPLVDITNYIMIDIGRPLHAYDIKKISGDTLTVRLAKTGEKFEALNGKVYDLNNEMLVISDEHGPDDLAGIMGGKRTGIDENTTEMFLESAIFLPNSVSNTGRKLNINSDARYRFERGLDFNSPEFGIKYASKFIQQICGGKMSFITFEATDIKLKEIDFSTDIVKRLIGIEIAENRILQILDDLGFIANKIKQGNFKVQVPTWRNDIDGKADLVEEIIRIYGYETIPIKLLKRNNYITKPSLKNKQRKNLYTRKSLTSRGYDEVVTFSFLDHKTAKLFGGGNYNLKLVNPISSELSDMRPSIIPNLLEAAVRNKNKGVNNISLFEVGPIFKDDNPEGQKTVATGLRTGNKKDKNWQSGEIQFDFYDLKLDVLECLKALSCPVSKLKIHDEAPSYFHPGRSGVFKLGNHLIACLGEINPTLLREINVKFPCFCFEIYLDNLPIPKNLSLSKPLLKSSVFQSVHRDFAFVLDDTIPVENLIMVIKNIDKHFIEEIFVFDIYKGPNIPKEKKSVALSVKMQPTDHTLTDHEIEKVCRNIIETVSKKLNGEIRKL